MARKSHEGWSYNDDRGGVGNRLLIARLEWVLRTLESARVPPHPASRLPRLLSIARAVNEDPTKLQDPIIRSQLEEAHRAAWEFMVILMAARRAPDGEDLFTREKLRATLGGQLTASEDKNTSARNAQFELFVPALLRVCGFDVLPGPPDARFVLNGEVLALEAKRVWTTNDSTLRKSLEEAANQIAGKPSSGEIEVVRSRGIIAINVDRHFALVEPSYDQSILIQSFTEALAKLGDAATVLAERHAILGYFAFGHISAWEQDPEDGVPLLATIYPTQFASLVGDDPAERQTHVAFGNALQKLARCVDSLKSKLPSK